MSAPTASPDPTPAAPARTMQDVILALQSFWASRGAYVAQPFNTEVGAGTGNPATALRVLGPEPWNVAYVEPSVRPDDARYGENPNRLQTHTQFQVILKPAPADPQELYLESLAAIGVDVHAHDLRFIEDNWASPALGAWGLGWEVWLDGLEITQFTYFQQAGGLPLDPVAVELTYGLERLVMGLQGIRHFKDIQYTDTMSYGDIYLQSEYEMSRYYLDDADVELNRTLFQSYATEAQQLLDLGLPVPAYSYVLKCSHTFNVLDARGAVSTTERARSFGLMRRLTREVSALWLARREELEYPLGTTPAQVPAEPQPLGEVSGTHDLLLEIGLEELPHRDVLLGSATVREQVEKVLGASSIAHGEVSVQATPRRIVVSVAGVGDREDDRTQTVRGPKAAAAYADGEPTKALLGFLRSKGAELDQVETTDVDGVDYVVVHTTIAGRSAPEVVRDLVDGAVRALRAETNMRWGDPELSYSRPIRWIVALLGDQVVPVTVSTLVAGGTTRVLRSAAEPEPRVPSATGYAAWLAEHGITLDRDERRAQVVAAAHELAATVSGQVDVDAEAGLVDEITDIVEAPTPVLGSFESRFLELPDPVLRTVMRKHQRYLAVSAADGTLLPHFITFANGPVDVDRVRAGNEDVIRARYEDAAFFWRADLKVPPADHRARLEQLIFEERLGSIDQRARRIAALGEQLAGTAGLDETATGTVRRAGELAKFDLATQLVVELSSLAGTMAREYALQAGETAEVADALAEMEMPRSAGAALPQSLAGAVLSLADRFDLVVSMYAIDAAPTGTTDPFGVRRAANGIIRVLRELPGLAAVSVSQGVELAAEQLRAQGVEVAPDVVEKAAEMIRSRVEQQLHETGGDQRVVGAVRGAVDRPQRADQLLTELTAFLERPEGPAVAAALSRAQRIVPAETAPGLDAEGPEEQELAAAVRATTERLAGRAGDLDALAGAAGDLPDVLERFMTSVHVMSQDPAERARRLALLASVLELGGGEVEWRVL
ncbi:glycine--tRNA ligase [Nocardioides litoris]|uniref:glycine--tRNA ligase n=1 Tax=Nocardioides litoris TaxID=1926648 RepID=UPI001B85D40D|nr:glycine--tRNA ligase [Nocardioides litoris]